MRRPWNLGGLSPGELVHPLEAANQVSIAGLHHYWCVGRKPSEGAQIGMVHVGMGEQNQVELRQVPRPKGRLDQPPGTELGEAAAQPDAPLQGGIGQYPGALEVHEHRGMAQPGKP